MKFVTLLIALLTFNSFAQDPKAYLGQFDRSVYSLKTKGVQDFTVDIESSKLTKQMNDQVTFGKISSLIFRTYWTANPERLAIEVIGMPDGFKEIKEELKAAIMSQMELLLPVPLEGKFPGYVFKTSGKPKEFIAQDKSGLAPIPSFVLKFDDKDRLFEIIGNKPVGSFTATMDYQKESFSDGKWVLKGQSSTVSENGQTVVSEKKLTYGLHQGMGVLQKALLTTTHKSDSGKAKPVETEEVLEFKNYKINTGDARKYFLGEGSQK